MHFDELHALLLSTSSDAWEHVGNRGGYLSAAALRADLFVTLEWGREHEVGGHEWVEKWSEAFPDAKLHGFYVDVFYAGRPVLSDLVLSVDGGRAYLPSGRPISEQGVGTTGMRVNNLELAVARLVKMTPRGVV